MLQNAVFFFIIIVGKYQHFDRWTFLEGSMNFSRQLVNYHSFFVLFSFRVRSRPTKLFLLSLILSLCSAVQFKDLFLIWIRELIWFFSSLLDWSCSFKLPLIGFFFLHWLNRIIMYNVAFCFRLLEKNKINKSLSSRPYFKSGACI